jgi:predicted flap endonuclease-1-like 5' DNA nuclease
MEEVEETRGVVEKAQDEVDEFLAEHPIDVKDKAALLAAAVPALGAASVAALNKVGVQDVDQFLAKGATAKGRAEMAEAVGSDAATVEKWVDDLNFARIRGIGPKYAALLRAAGVETVEDLGKYNAEDLAKKLADVNASQNLVKDLPSAEHLAFWIAQASELPPALAHVAIKVHKDMLDVNAYSWHAAEHDDPHKIKFDAVMFNRKEGYEVIPMIQKVADTFGFETVDDVKRVEAVIANELPGNVRSRENVYNWLVEYFETH